MTIFASCSQDENLIEENSSSAISFLTSLPENGLQSRAADTSVKRYIMQLYADGTVVDLNPSEDVTNYSIINSDGVFQIDGNACGLQRDVTYSAVFWADYDEATAESPTYDVSWLNWVQLNEGKDMAMAYCGKLDFIYGRATNEYQVTLKRAVAQVNLKQKTTYTAGEGDKIAAAYQRYINFNAFTSDVPEGAGTSEAQTEITVTGGEKAAGDVLGSFLVFASPNGTTTDFTFSYGENVVGSVNNVPLKANYQTNITGDFGSVTTDYTFTVSSDDSWNGAEDNDLGGVTPEDKVAPTFEVTIPESVTLENSQATISYSINVADETALATSGKVRFMDSEWTVIEEKEFTFDASSTTASMTGSFNVTAAGSYKIDYTVYDAAGNQGYGNKDITVQEAAATE